LNRSPRIAAAVSGMPEDLGVARAWRWALPLQSGSSGGFLQLILAAALLYLVLLGGTEAGRVATSLRAVGIFVGATVIVCYLWRMPRENDLTDRLVLAGLLLFLVTCVTSSDTRSSFDAATSALAYAAAFYLARGAIAGRGGGEAAITVLGSVGIVIGLVFLFLWGAIWLRWTLIPGAGLPPFDLKLPVLLYRHQYPVGMLAALLMPATLVLARRPIIWPLAGVGCGATFVVAFLSGGRAIWLAGAAAAVVAVLTAVITARGARGPLNRRPIRLTAMAMIAGIVVIVAAPFFSRVGATTTIDLRFSIWRTAISHWLDSAIVGFGPGTFQREFSMTGYYNKFEPNIPHAHNVLVQILFEGGIVGMLGLGLVCAGVTAGIARHRRLHWSSAAALAFFVVVSMADNPAVVPFLVGPLIVWAALASPRAAPRELGRRNVSHHRPPAGPDMADAQPALGDAMNRPDVVRESRQGKVVRALTLTAASIVAVVTLAIVTASWSFDRAASAATMGQTTQVVSNLSMAATLDPAFALYHRELGVWLQSEGDLAAARDQLAAAIRLNPADNQAYRAASLLYGSEGKRDEAIAFASSAAALQATHVENALTLAYVNGVIGDIEGQHAALVAAVRFAPWLTAAPEWGAAFPDAEPGQVLRDAYQSWQSDVERSTRNLKARAWLAGLVGATPPDGATPAMQVETDLLACRTDQAAQELAGVVGTAATELETLEARFLFERAYGRGASRNVVALIRLRDPGLADSIAHQAVGVSPVWSFFYDNRYYDRIAINPPAGPVLPTPGSGLSAWLRDPVAAAERGAPGSGLATCR
jgi:O-antigen ligase